MDNKQAKERFDQASRLYAQGRYNEAALILDALLREFPANTQLQQAKKACTQGLQPTAAAGSVVPLISDADPPVAVCPDAHTVARPGRVGDSHNKDWQVPAARLVLRYCIVAPICFAVLGFVSFLVFPSEDAIRSQDVATYRIVALMISMLMNLFMVVASFCAGAVFSLRLVILGRRRPKMDTPLDTVVTFVNALGNQFYARAYNCLTDQAQAPAEIQYPRNDYLRQAMPVPVFSDLEGFRRFYERCRLQFWAAHTDMVETEQLAKGLVKLKMPIVAMWNVRGGQNAGLQNLTGEAFLSMFLNPGPLSEPGVGERPLFFRGPWHDSDNELRGNVREVFESTFILKEVGGNWFMLNGVIWPSGAIHAAAPEKHPAKYAGQ